LRLDTFRERQSTGTKSFTREESYSRMAMCHWPISFTGMFFCACDNVRTAQSGVGGYHISRMYGTVARDSTGWEPDHWRRIRRAAVIGTRSRVDDDEDVKWEDVDSVRCLMPSRQTIHPIVNGRLMAQSHLETLVILRLLFLFCVVLAVERQR
jgi:hypothetical protein